MNNVAFVTYNSVGDNLSSGWHGSGERRALVLQNTRGRRWAVEPRTGIHADRVMGEIGDLWGQLQQALSELDHIVIYVGDSGSEHAIELAAKLPASKVTFVACGCGFARKESMARAVVGLEARVLSCECGGHRTMGRLFQRFMDSGEL